jgi:hypothetical protein
MVMMALSEHIVSFFELVLSGLGGVPCHLQNLLQAATSVTIHGLVLFYQIQNNFYILLYVFNRFFR